MFSCNEVTGGEISRQRTINNMLLAFQSRQNSIYYVASIDKGFKTITTCCLQHLKQLHKVRHFEESNARMRILFLSRRSPPVRLGYVTETN